MGDSGIGDALRETFNSYKRNLKLASLVIYMVIKRTNAMHHYEPFSKITWLPWSRPMNDGQIKSNSNQVNSDLRGERVELHNTQYKLLCQPARGEATYILKDGKLTDQFSYLADYAAGNVKK